MGFEAALVALSIGSLVSWFLLNRWTERGTSQGLQVSPVSSAAGGVVGLAFLIKIVLTGFLDVDMSSTEMQIVRWVLLAAYLGGLVVWALSERRRRLVPSDVVSG